LIFPFIK